MKTLISVMISLLARIEISIGSLLSWLRAGTSGRARATPLARLAATKARRDFLGLITCIWGSFHGHEAGNCARPRAAATGPPRSTTPTTLRRTGKVVGIGGQAFRSRLFFWAFPNLSRGDRRQVLVCCRAAQWT